MRRPMIALRKLVRSLTAALHEASLQLELYAGPKDAATHAMIRTNRSVVEKARSVLNSAKDQRP